LDLALLFQPLPSWVQPPLAVLHLMGTSSYLSTVEILKRREGFMAMLSKVCSVLAISSAVLFFGCSHKAHADSKTISASSDSKGNHPASSAVQGPVQITCVSATDDSGNPTPPACVIDGPGTTGVVDVGHKVAITSAGNVTLTCKGAGTLACTARIDE